MRGERGGKPQAGKTLRRLIGGSAWRAVLWLAAASVARGQTSPFLDESVGSLLANELSGEVAFENLRITTSGHKLSGSSDYFATARYVMEKAKSYGLEDVRWIDQKGEHPYWEARSADAWLLSGDGPGAKETKLGTYVGAAMSVADFSRPTDVTAEVVDVGSGESAADYRGRDVRGKIVLAFGNLATVTEQAVWKRGAAGILSHNSTRLNPLADSPDQVAWIRVPQKDGPKGEKTTFAFVLTPREGQDLVERLRGEHTRRTFGESARKKERLRARVVIDSRFLPDGKTAMVEARLRGTDASLPEVVLTSHLQEANSANDDQSGVVSVLEIGRTLARLIREGKLPRPRRGIRFWWCDEIYSEYRYFADHPEEAGKILANLNQDMVGARQTIGGRVQYMARPPWSRASFLGDVQESILDAVVAGNNAYLAAWASQSPPPGVAFSRPIFSRLGSREPFHARAVPYFGQTDHLVFNDAWVGVPATSLTNWPDEYIHSSDDDLWQIDKTQLKRNAFIVAATAWWLATADASGIPHLASFVAARGIERLGRDLATGLAGSVESGDRTARYRSAANLLAVSLAKEKRALASTLAIGPVATGASPETDELLRNRFAVMDQAAREMQALLYSSYGSPPETGAGGDSEDPVLKRLAARIPRKAAKTLDEWLGLQERARDKREAEARAKREEGERKEEAARPGRRAAAPSEAPGPGALSSLMQFETLNWVDGRTDAAEIARSVAAEALSAGRWYYGDATPEMVEKFLESQAKLGLILW